MCDSLKEKMQTIKINKVNQNAILDFNFEIKKYVQNNENRHNI